MNRFFELFGKRIRSYWDSASEDEKQVLLGEVLQYANAHPEAFKKEIAAIQFDKDLVPLPIVIEALSKDTDTWGPFFVDTLHTIFEQARLRKDPRVALSCLMEYAYIEQQNKPFVQKIVDKLYKESSADFLPARLAAIWLLPAYLTNSVVRNRPAIIQALQQMLHDPHWKVRYTAYTALGFEGMLPPGYKLSVADKLRKLVFGAPSVV